MPKHIFNLPFVQLDKYNNFSILNRGLPVQWINCIFPLKIGNLITETQFENIRQNVENCFYVSIQQVIHKLQYIILDTRLIDRPRRYGKST